MDDIFECYFSQVFVDLARGDLLARHKRRDVIDYFRTIVTGCCRAGVCDPVTGYRLAVRACLRHHEDSKRANGGVCLRGKHHSLLYIAAKLAFDGRVEGGVVAELLKDIHGCEGTFEKLFVGAIFGTKAAYLMIGWSSDFDSREENVKALAYFLAQADKDKLRFGTKCESVRLVEYPMESYGLSTPLRSAVLLNKPDVVHVLLRHGATLNTDEHGYTPIIDVVIDRLLESYKLQRGHVSLDTVKCLRLLLTTVSRVKLKIREQLEEREMKRFVEVFPCVPTGAVTLKQMCRCAVRERLNENWELPKGIYELKVPVTVQRYLDLEDE